MAQSDLILFNLNEIRRRSIRLWEAFSAKPKTLYLLLIGWTIFGFFTKLDYTLLWGCIVSYEPTFSTENIFFSGTAIGLLSFGVFIPKKQVGVLLLFAELLFWLFKLFFIKGGYVVGIGGPSYDVLTFDFIALSLRLLLLKQLGLLPVRIFKVLILVFLIMLLKIFFFI
ncbi:hypothetical protein [Leeuwenhoekiella nanhaiensis]|uniref:Uncharacterized protein n=1 Tax=Leeuwenhoekiella nanhaiensis TaxID=1655491 RepID=A0A2G1VR45_9FLAO|nr:hypothetical protein [Leeuwenhoekiella nanhaiensis]PHQ29225.1 hypothetical protein CJ305_11515 [Leeuwenhoekiella nanhaiensis]